MDFSRWPLKIENTFAATHFIFTDIAATHRDGAEVQEETAEMKDEEGAIESEGEYAEGDDMQIHFII